jgi:hypothetical protein
VQCNETSNMVYTFKPLGAGVVGLRKFKETFQYVCHLHATNNRLIGVDYSRMVCMHVSSTLTLVIYWLGYILNLKCENRNGNDTKVNMHTDMVHPVYPSIKNQWRWSSPLRKCQNVVDACLCVWRNSLKLCIFFQVMHDRYYFRRRNGQLQCHSLGSGIRMSDWIQNVT